MSLCLSKDVKVNDENKTCEDKNAQNSFIFGFLPEKFPVLNVLRCARLSWKGCSNLLFISNASTAKSSSCWFNDIFFRLLRLHSSAEKLYSDRNKLKFGSKPCERQLKFRFNFLLVNARNFQLSQYALIPVQQQILCLTVWLRAFNTERCSSIKSILYWRYWHGRVYSRNQVGSNKVLKALLRLKLPFNAFVFQFSYFHSRITLKSSETISSDTQLLNECTPDTLWKGSW